MAGNVGTQSLAVTIRVLMDETLTGRQKAELVLKEMRIGLCNGGLLGILSFVLIGLYIFLFKGKTLVFAYAVSGCIGLSLLVAMLVSSRNLHTAVFQKGWCGPGSSLRSSDHYGERSCSRDNVLWNELDIPDRDVPPGWLRVKCSYAHKNRQISEICRITEKLPIQKNSGSKDSGFFFTYKQKAIIIKDTLCPFKTLQK